jgi:two-component system, OmpR family, response regulator
MIAMKKVLIVDDIKNIRNLLTTCLEVEGYKVESTMDGIKALEIIENEKFDLIFMDIKLPELSGTEVLRRIRKMGITTPVIIMTAFATVKNAVECTKLGAVAYLQKPFTAEKVRHVLTEIIGGSEDNAFYHQQAKELIAVGKMNDAYGQLKKALALDPDCGETYELIAEIYEAKGDTKAAERFYRIAQQFNVEQ